MLKLHNGVTEKLYSHAQAEYPRECCGILLGRRRENCRIAGIMVRTGNMAEASRSRTQYLINPLDIVRAEEAGEKEGLEIVGFYHSHPDCEAVASKEDILHMLAGYSYLILSVKNGVCAAMCSYEKLMQTDTGANEETVIKERGYADFGICISNTEDICRSESKD